MGEDMARRCNPKRTGGKSGPGMRGRTPTRGMPTTGCWMTGDGSSHTRMAPRTISPALECLMLPPAGTRRMYSAGRRRIHGRPASVLTGRGARLCRRVRVREGGGVRRSSRRVSPAGHAARAGTHQPPADRRQAGEVLRGAAAQATLGSSARHATGPSAVRLLAVRGTCSTRRGRRIRRPGRSNSTTMTGGTCTSEGRGTPTRTFRRKTPPPGAKVVTDKQAGKQYRVRWGGGGWGTPLLRSRSNSKSGTSLDTLRFITTT